METKKRNKRTLEGTVLSNKMDSTVIVRVTFKLPHPKYGKVMKRYRKFKAHTGEKLNEGEVVKIRESKPFSKEVAWVVVK